MSSAWKWRPDNIPLAFSPSHAVPSPFLSWLTADTLRYILKREHKSRKQTRGQKSWPDGPW